jgi:mannosyltransferase OCH1-like enzyme
MSANLNTNAIDLKSIPPCSQHLQFAKYMTFVPKGYNYIDTSDIIPKIPKILHMIWVGNDYVQPIYVHQNFMYWQKLMPGWTFKLWNDNDINSDNFPDDIVTIINSATKGAQKADIMRYFIMYKFGGVYMDSDITPHRSLDYILHTFPKADVVLCHDIDLTWEYCSIGFFASVPKHNLFNIICNLIRHVQINTLDLHMHTGPRLLGRAFVHNVDPVILLPSECFYGNLDNNARFGNHFYAKNW